MVRKNLSVFVCAFLSCIGAAIFAVAQQPPAYCTAGIPKLSAPYGGNYYPTGNPNTKNYQLCIDCTITCSASGLQSGCNVCFESVFYDNTAGDEISDTFTGLDGYQTCDTTHTTTFTNTSSNVVVGSSYTVTFIAYPYIPGPGAPGCQRQDNSESQGVEKSATFTVPK